LPLNITPAITSIHPPLWWNGPLGPLTTDRDLYAVSSRGLVYRAIPTGEKDWDDRLAHRGLADRLDLADRFALRGLTGPWVPRPVRDPLDRVRPARLRAVP
jgi:hypothetical protein